MKLRFAWPVLGALAAVVAFAQARTEAVIDVVVFQAAGAPEVGGDPGEWLAAVLESPDTHVLGRSTFRMRSGERGSFTAGTLAPALPGCPGSEEQTGDDVAVGVEATLRGVTEGEVDVHLDTTVAAARNFVRLGCLAQPVRRPDLALNLRLRSGRTSVVKREAYWVAVAPRVVGEGGR